MPRIACACVVMRRGTGLRQGGAPLVALPPRSNRQRKAVMSVIHKVAYYGIIPLIAVLGERGVGGGRRAWVCPCV